MKKLFSFSNRSFFGTVSLFLLFLTGCNKQASQPTPRPPGNEFLTTVELVLHNTANPADAPIAIWRQLDPTGAAPPGYK